jgi:hypothetical protein
MPNLCLITVPGLKVSSDWRLVHDRLLDEFPEVTDVLATTIKETILVVYEHAAPGDSGRWLDTVSETLLHRRKRNGTPRRVMENHGGQFATERWRSPAGAPVGAA